MTTRRTIVRPPRPKTVAEAKTVRRRQKLQTQLERAHAGVERWQRKLKRAFNSVDKHQTQIARISRELDKLRS